MHPTFFPDYLFGWAFYLTLVGFMALATFSDLRRMIIPKWISLTLLGLGLLFNVVRGAWLGSLGLPVWQLGVNGTLVGGVDGLLFALSGFALYFVLFTALWCAGVCGGGDVKLFAALSAWVGPTLAFAVLAATVLLMFLTTFAVFVWRFVTAGVWKTARKFKLREHFSYASQMALATALVALWAYRVDLHLAAPPKPSHERVQIHVP
jgi:prepilin peptidase CpaA